MYRWPQEGAKHLFELEQSSHQPSPHLFATLDGVVNLRVGANNRNPTTFPRQDRCAETVRLIFRRYLDLGSVRELQEDLLKQDIKSKSGQALSRGALYDLLANPLYVGEVRHKDARYPGQHQAIIDRELWDEVQARLAKNAPDRQDIRKTDVSPLAGKLFDEVGERLTPNHSVNKGRRYRYYVSSALVTGLAGQNPGWRLPAHEIEKTVAGAVMTFLGDQTTIGNAARQAGLSAERLPILLESIDQRDGNPLSQVERVDLSASGLMLRLGLEALAGEALTIPPPFP